MTKVYVASSWRNQHQPNMVQQLQNDGHRVYDFRNPPSKTGFSWDDVGLEDNPTLGNYRTALENPIAIAGFYSDYGAMQWADCCVLLLPCGRSAHLEAGWFIGQGKPVYIYIPNDRESFEPELMYLMANRIGHNLYNLKEWVKNVS